MSTHVYDIIKAPVITEKGSKQWEQGKYFFRVHPSATKLDIKKAVEEIFHVNVLRVNTISVRGKWKRLRYQPGKTSDWKKAIVTIKAGQKIEFA